MIQETTWLNDGVRMSKDDYSTDREANRQLKIREIEFLHFLYWPAPEATELFYYIFLALNDAKSTKTWSLAS